MKLWRLTTLSILLLLLGACSSPQPKQTDLNPQANYWQQLGSSTAIGSNISLATDETTLYPVMAYYVQDGTLSIYVKRWTGTSWVLLGTTSLDIFTNQDAKNPSLALDNSGNPVVSWEESDGSSSNIYVKRWDGSGWIQLGGILDVNFNQTASNPNLALDAAGNPTVSWYEFDGSSSNIYVKRWDGSGWTQPGTILDANTNQNAANPSLALDAAGNPTVSWYEFDGSSSNIYVKRWDGSGWTQLGTILDANTNEFAANPSLALDAAGNPTVSWLEFDGTSNSIYVKRWDGSSWTQLGTILDASINQDAFDPSLALDAAGNPMVSWWEYDGISTSIHAKQWTGSSWTLVGSNPLDTSLGNNAYYPSLSLVSGSLSVAWQEGSDSNSDSLYVKKYVTNAWQATGSLLDIQGGQSAINSVVARKSNNLATVTWDEVDSNNGSRNVYVKEWTGTTWSLLGGAIDRTLANDAENPSITIRSDNRPTVAFQENNNIYVKRWSGSSWINVSNSSINFSSNNAITPSIARETITNLPVVAYSEGGVISVTKANGVIASSSWSYFSGGGLNNNPANEAFRPSLALKTDNLPIVAWYEDNGTSFDIFVKERVGGSWVPLGGAIDKTVSRDAKDIVLAIRTDNRPVVAWEEAGNIYVKRWNGTSWVAVGGVLDKTAGNEALRPSIDLRSDNNPVVTWQEWNGNSYDVWVKRWTGSAWTLIANVADKNTSRDAERPSIVLKSDNNPIISWDEWDGLSENIYVKQF